jgi:hypothetical protein
MDTRNFMEKRLYNINWKFAYNRKIKIYVKYLKYICIYISMAMFMSL